MGQSSALIVQENHDQFTKDKTRSTVHLEQRPAIPGFRNENLMQLSHNLEISLPGVDSWQAVQDDTQLVKASQQGDQDAFALLVQKHQRRVFNMSLRMLQDYEEASEITQEAFLAP